MMAPTIVWCGSPTPRRRRWRARLLNWWYGVEWLLAGPDDRAIAVNTMAAAVRVGE